MGLYPPSLPGEWGQLGFTEPPAPEYVYGLADLAKICSLVHRPTFWGRLFGKKPDQVLIHDLNPPEFWQLVESSGCIETASVEIGPGNVIFYLNRDDNLGPDHPIVEWKKRGLVTIRQTMAHLPFGFRVADRGSDFTVTQMRPNPNAPQFPLIRRLDRDNSGIALNEIENLLDQGYYDDGKY